MKEYKVVNLKLGLSRRLEKMEDELNKYAREGWELKQIHQNLITAVFEREKNKY